MLNSYCLSRVKSTRDSRDMAVVAMVASFLIFIGTLRSSLQSAVSLAFHIFASRSYSKSLSKILKINRPKQSLEILKVIWACWYRSRGCLLGVFLHTGFLKAVTSMSRSPKGLGFIFLLMIEIFVLSLHSPCWRKSGFSGGWSLTSVNCAAITAAQLRDKK